MPKSAVFPAAAADTTEIIRVPRPTDSVRTERDRYLGERRDVEARWLALRDQEGRLRTSISEVRTAMDAAGARDKRARKEKKEDERIAAAAERERLDRSFVLLESRLDLRRAQVEQTRIEREYLDAAIRADDAELVIAERRDQVSMDEPTQRGAFQELTSRWLQALRTRTARSFDLEDRRFKVVEAQIALLRRQRS
ncbi:MAG TPA: hypothetical protein VE861_01860 [Gemmatimonadaceae bacterium]|nr:hypothetical protein [Gemmatimonadaceae bacterium]